MTQIQQPEALRLAAICETKGMFPVADELNRMHARILELEQGKCLHQIAEPAVQGLDALNLTAHEYEQLLKAVEDYQESGETDVPDETLMRGVAAGYLECGHFKLINLAALERDAAAAGVA